MSTKIAASLLLMVLLTPRMVYGLGGLHVPSAMLKERPTLQNDEARRHLLSVLEKGEEAKLRRLLRNGQNPNTRLKQDFHLQVSLRPQPPTLLMYAVYYGHARLVRLLLKNRASLEAPGDFLVETYRDYDSSEVEIMTRATALNIAACKGNRAMVDLLLRHGADVNRQDADGWSPLFWAASQENQETVELLLKRGAKINLQSKGGETPLFVAVRHGHLRSVQRLIRAGANVGIKNKKNEDVLTVASNLERTDIYSYLKSILDHR